jgi:predicted nucleic acid-binding protein
LAQQRYLLDTNILVHLIRQDATGQQIRDAYAPLLADPRPVLSVVTDGEIRSLAYQWHWGEAKKEQMRFLLGYFDRVGVDAPQILEAYAVIDAHSEAIGHTMGKNDVWIAAAAHVTGARLLTTDTDFDHLHAAGFLVRDRIAAAVEG